MEIENAIRHYLQVIHSMIKDTSTPILKNCTYVNWLEYPGYIMMHRHDNMAEVTLIVHGRGQYAVNNHIYDVKVGDVILSGAGVVHDAFMQEREHYGTLTIQVEGLQTPGCAPGQFLPRDQIPVFHLPKQYPELRRQMSEIRELFGIENAEYREACQEKAETVLELVADMIRDSGRPAQKVDSFCLEIEEYINEHYAEELSLESVAAAFYVSTFHLSHLFKKETGYNFKQYLMRMRIGEAQKIFLDDERARIADVAQRVGYEDASYFSRAFQKETGMSPKEYKNYISVMR